VARNIGIVTSAGKIVVFIDNAVPEPTSPTYLIAFFLGMKSMLWVVL
jgi:hypothetical protein